MSFEITLAPWQRRIFAILLTAVVLAVLSYEIVEAVKARNEHHAELLFYAKEQVASERVIAQYPRRLAQIARLKAFIRDQSLLYPRAPVAVLRAQMQAQLASAIALGGGTQVVQLPVPAAVAAAPAMPVEEATIVVDFRSDIAGLSRILYRLAQAKPLLFVDRISVRDPKAMMGPIPLDAGPRQLQTELTVVAYAGAP